MQTVNSHAGYTFSCRLGILAQTVILTPIVSLMQTVILMGTKHTKGLGTPGRYLAKTISCNACTL